MAHIFRGSLYIIGLFIALNQHAAAQSSTDSSNGICILMPSGSLSIEDMVAENVNNVIGSTPPRNNPEPTAPPAAENPTPPATDNNTGGEVPAPTTPVTPEPEQPAVPPAQPSPPVVETPEPPAPEEPTQPATVASPHHFSVINRTTMQEVLSLQQLSNDDSINLNQLSDEDGVPEINIRATFTDGETEPAGVGSVIFTVTSNGETVEYIDSEAPFTLFEDGVPAETPAGTYRLTATAASGANGQGTRSETITLTLALTRPEQKPQIVAFLVDDATEELLPLAEEQTTTLRVPQGQQAVMGTIFADVEPKTFTLAKMRFTLAITGGGAAPVNVTAEDTAAPFTATTQPVAYERGKTYAVKIEALDAADEVVVTQNVTLVMEQPTTTTTDPAAVKYRIARLDESLKAPWAIVAEPQSTRLFITEQEGLVKIWDTATSAYIATINLNTALDDRKVHMQAQGGLHDVAFHPDYPATPTVYFYYVTRNAANDVRPRVVALDYNRASQQFTRLREIWMESAAIADPNHFGGRLAFDRSGKLYISLGERHMQNQAQRTDNYQGKILRLNADGTTPTDNPFRSTNNAIAAKVFSYGHRNPQGLDIHPASGIIISAEHGPSNEINKGGSQDEINHIRAGLNYGWPVIAGAETREGMERALWWRDKSLVATAPSGATFYSGAALKIPAWQNDYFTANLRDQTIYRFRISGTGQLQGAPQSIKIGSRVRDVTTGADGYLYFITNITDWMKNEVDAGPGIGRIEPEAD